MDSPVRSTRPEDMHNIREEIRGGKLRTVWDEVDTNGRIVKTAVWDILDRSGRPIGEQSWDEYERYIDAMREQTEKKRPVTKFERMEKRKKLREEAIQRREEKRYKHRMELAAALEYFLEDHPDPIMQIPLYKFCTMLGPYFEKLGSEEMPPRKAAMIINNNREYFESMGFTFGKGWSRLTRTECYYMGYLTTQQEKEYRAKDERDAKICAIVQEIPPGQYGRLRLAAIVHAKYMDISVANLGWILARNAKKYGLEYSWNFDMFIKE